MNILFIAPLPPPVHGQSFVSKKLLDYLKNDSKVKIVNISKKNIESNLYKIMRLGEILKVTIKVWKLRKKNDVIYLTISESMGGNFKDLLFYLVLIANLKKIVIHLHGGSIKKDLWDKYKWSYRLNKQFIKRFGGVIISGRSHNDIFKGMVDNEKIHVVPNFVSSNFLTNEDKVLKCYSDLKTLKILYLSSLREKKGYLDLFEAYKLLTDKHQESVEIHFAGAFNSDSKKNEFLKKISNFHKITYHGIVHDEKKKELLWTSHIFCLPTKYYEGQPISILEAYAAGCAVVTTGLGGIIDIFKEPDNGLQCTPSDPNSLARVIEDCITQKDILKSIAIKNYNLAKQKYDLDKFNNSILNIFENIHR